jgi:hypothetical protein
MTPTHVAFPALENRFIWKVIATRGATLCLSRKGQTLWILRTHVIPLKFKV